MKLLVILLIIPEFILAQGIQLWEEVPSNARLENSFRGMQANIKRLNMEVLDDLLSKASDNKASMLPIPHPSGNDVIFEIKPAHVMARGLSERHPEIQTFKGVGKNGEILRIDMGVTGFHGAIYMADGGTVYIDPVSERSNVYGSYFKSEYMFVNRDEIAPLTEHAHEHQGEGVMGTQGDGARTTGSEATSVRVNFQKRTIGDQLRKYRIAISAHPTFTEAVGRSNVLSKMVTLLNRTVAIYERDFGITLELVADNDKLIFTDDNRGGFADTYTSSSFFGETINIIKARQANIEVLNDIIGVENYDVGHVFGAGPASEGIASVGATCDDNAGRKAAGISSFRTPELQSTGMVGLQTLFEHELAHLFGATHTMNDSGCFGGPGQFTNPSNFEPGSGSTLLGYPSLCAPNNIKQQRDEYFHAASIQQVWDYTIDGRGGNCTELVATGNTPPIVKVRDSDFVIPVNTPFVLEAEASDDDGDVLTYCWEQLDKGKDDKGTTLPGNKKNGNHAFDGTGPLFRSFPPTANPKRYFPRLSKIVEGKNPKEEHMPSITRELNFVVTIRDNNVLGGGMTTDIVSFSSTIDAGPFVVTSEVDASPYDGFTNYQVEWDVANTNLAPVNCQQVNILFSIDGGESFAYRLLENTPNDGSEEVRLPNIQTTKARIMVAAADNVFFNVNTTDFAINTVSTPLPQDPTTLAGSQLNAFEIELSWQDNSEVEDGFIIERKDDASTEFVEISRVVFNHTSFIDASIEEGKTYTYRVASFNTTGTSAYTNSISIDTENSDEEENEEDEEGEEVLSVTDEAFVTYPNPTTGMVFLQNVPSHTRYFIYDVAGFLIDNGIVRDNQLEIIGTNGLYNLIIQSSDGEMSTIQVLKIAN
ncbi:MAG: reprolysin-like metallopeptidase [Bacteroidota bacterium]